MFHRSRVYLFNLFHILALREFVLECVILINSITITVQHLVLHTFLCHLELTTEDEHGQFLAILGVREVLQRVLCGDNAGLIVVTHIVAQIVVEGCCPHLLLHQTVVHGVIISLASSAYLLPGYNSRNC